MVTKSVIPDIAKYLQEITVRAPRHAGRCHRTYIIPYLCPDCKGDNLFFLHFVCLSGQRPDRKLNSLPVEEPDEIDQAMLAEAEALNDGTAVTLEEFQRSVGDYSGRLNIRIPKSLHQRLSQEAKSDGVSLNQYILYKLAR